MSGAIHRVSLYAFVRALGTPHMEPKMRALYGVIASERGAVVSRETIINAVWGTRWRDGKVWELEAHDAARPANPLIAMNVMVFRLRALGYDIKTHGKRGYSLKGAE